MSVKLVSSVAIALTDSEIATLKEGKPVFMDGGLVLLKGQDGKAHIAKCTANKRPFSVFEMPVNSGNEVFRLTGEEALKAIEAYMTGKGSITCYRTAGADESRAKPETCSIQVDIAVLPNNGIDPKEHLKDFSAWHISEHNVRFVKQGYELGQAVIITKKVDEISL